MAFSRKKYSGPMKDRGTVERGGKRIANVSKEELDDFRKKYGADKTLRDLLNAERTGKMPPPKKKKLPDDIDAQLNTAREDAAAKKRAERDLEVTPPTAQDMPRSSLPSGSIMSKGAQARDEYTPMKPSLEEQQDAAIAKQARIKKQDEDVGSPGLNALGRIFRAIRERGNATLPPEMRSKKGGMIKKKAASKPAAKKMGGGSMKYSKGGSTGRGDGIAQRGKTKGRMC